MIYDPRHSVAQIVQIAEQEGMTVLDVAFNAFLAAVQVEIESEDDTAITTGNPMRSESMIYGDLLRTLNARITASIPTG